MAGNSKNYLNPFHVVSAQAMTSTFHSTPTNVQTFDNLCYQVQWATSTAVGIFTVEGSSDYVQAAGGSVTNTGTWINLPLSSSLTAASANDNAMIDLNELPYTWIRLTYTASSGTGTCDAYIAGKGI